jgi:hypothetical protein
MGRSLMIVWTKYKQLQATVMMNKHAEMHIWSTELETGGGDKPVDPYLAKFCMYCHPLCK